MKKNKKTIIIAVLTAAGLVVLLFQAYRFVGPLLEKQIEKYLTGAVVSVGEYRFRNAGEFFIEDIKIAKKDDYSLEIGELSIKYDVLSVIKGNIGKVSVKKAVVKANLSRLIDGGTGTASKSEKSAYFSVKEIEFSEITTNLKTKYIEIEGNGSITVFPKEKRIGQTDINVRRVKGYGMLIEGGRIKGNIGDKGADISVDRIAYNDIKVTGAAGTLCSRGILVTLEILTAKVFNGDVRGNIEARLENDGEFSAALFFLGMDLSSFMRELKLTEKVNLTGNVKGEIFIKGRGLEVSDINGEFSTDVSGGVLEIKDTSFLERMAKNSNQPLDILMDNFKNYRYNKGDMKVFLSDDDLALDVAMDGEAGKRVFNVILHDVISHKRREP